MIRVPEGGWRAWLSPLVYLSSNRISLLGVVTVTTAAVLWVFQLPLFLRGEVDNPYTGILTFLVLPGVFFGGLVLIPLGIWREARKRRRSGQLAPVLPPLDWRSPELRRLLAFVGVTTMVNLVIGSQLTYRAFHYMDTVTFCGKTCHKVMAPEFAAYQGSPHSRVACVACHIGPGASWFVRSKLSGVGQVFATLLNTYPRPIPTPVANLRPARETCEQCHWPQKFGADRLRIIARFAEDEANTRTFTVLLMHIGGGHDRRGIHGSHLDPGVTIEYAHADRARQNIPWVRYTNSVTGRTAVYLAADATPESVRNLPRRTMDCMDCHNRPTHAFESPEAAVDRAMAAGSIAPSLPSIKKLGVELLRKQYPSQEVAAISIPAALEQHYRSRDAALYARQRDEILRAARALVDIHNRNVFPLMKVTWGTYPNNIGHMEFPGCFRCHDDRTAADGRKLTQDCNTCHRVLAMDEPAPAILSQLGLSQANGH
ncbi:MAG: NapC/NirT family cytochrome c [Bryobacteraceae bacterium]